MTKPNQLRYMAIAAMFSAIIILLAFTPLGFIPLPFMRATTVHIPVIIGSIFLGPKYGAFLGLLFGLTSFYNNTVIPLPTSFVFSPFVPVPGTGQGNPLALIVVFVPRILVGVVPWYVNKGLKKLSLPTCEQTDEAQSEETQLSWQEKLKRFFSQPSVSYTLSGVAGSLTNTLLVMHFIFLFFREPWAAARSTEPVHNIYMVILSIIAINGIPEAIVAGILVAAIGLALGLGFRRMQG